MNISLFILFPFNLKFCGEMFYVFFVFVLSYIFRAETGIVLEFYVKITFFKKHFYIITVDLSWH